MIADTDFQKSFFTIALALAALANVVLFVTQFFGIVSHVVINHDRSVLNCKK